MHVDRTFALCALALFTSASSWAAPACPDCVQRAEARVREAVTRRLVGGAVGQQGSDDFSDAWLRWHPLAQLEPVRAAGGCQVGSADDKSGGALAALVTAWLVLGCTRPRRQRR